MEKDLDKYIKAIRKDVKPFENKAPVIPSHFMLSYDESIDALEDKDFRPYIIAALHAKGAINIESYVASTILFTADSQEGFASIALKNWKKYLNDVFGPEIHIMLCIIVKYTSGGPVFDKIPNPNIEAEFKTRKEKVIEKFKTLPQ